MTHDFREISCEGDFQECPPDVECPVGFDIIRTPSKGSLDCVILSEVAMGKYTHWWHGRTQPCLSVECPKCLQGSPRRWHSWLAVYHTSSQRVFLLEVPAGPAKSLADYRSKHGTLRGVGVSVHRANGKPNGPVRLGFARMRDSGSILPACPDVAAMLERMWSARPGYDTDIAAPKIAVHQPDELKAAGA